MTFATLKSAFQQIDLLSQSPFALFKWLTIETKQITIRKHEKIHIH